MASSLSSISEILSSRRINEGTSMIFKTLLQFPDQLSPVFLLGNIPLSVGNIPVSS